MALSVRRLSLGADRIAVDPQWIVAFIGPGVAESYALRLEDAQLFWRRDELGVTEIVYLTVETAQARGWLPDELGLILW